MAGEASHLGGDLNSHNNDYVMVAEPQIAAQDELPDVFRLPSCNGHNLYEITVDELQHLFSSGALTSVQYVQFCLDRVQRVSSTRVDVSKTKQ